MPFNYDATSAADARIDERRVLLARTRAIIKIIMDRERYDSSDYKRDTRCCATLELFFSVLIGYGEHTALCDAATKQLDNEWDAHTTFDRALRERDRHA